ncbi:MAG: hypothetical protein GKR90_09535 [Pseudomonadales bacterium]|nr:hypothetical protein [Pseudomonadales bacterium]
MPTLQKALPWVLVIYIAFVFIQSLFFKFSGSEETIIIFNTISDWMAGTSLLSAVSEPFRSYGGNLVGLTELVASILLFIPRLRIWGAIIALGTISGAIFFHLFTPLGVVRTIDAMGNTDGGVLFYMACGVWIASALTIYLNRDQLPGVSR